MMWNTLKSSILVLTAQLNREMLELYDFVPVIIDIRYATPVLN